MKLKWPLLVIRLYMKEAILFGIKKQLQAEAGKEEIKKKKKKKKKN